jgi:HEAT repeat protein
VELYLADPESDEGGQALAVIHYRGGSEEFANGARLAKGATEQERIAGADILAQLGWGERTHLEESVSILLELLHDSSEGVVSAAAIALGHRNHPAAIQPLVELSEHPNPDVRYGVVHGLSGHDDLTAVGALIRLASDPDRDVRNWATFGVAQLTELDSPTIREALLARADDHDPEIRGEALLGLARRADARALPLVRRELSGEFHGDWAVEAAELLADPTLYPLLEVLQRRLEPEDHARFERSFADAMKSCKPGR